MGYWNSKINGFVPYQNKEKTFIEYKLRKAVC